MAFNGLNPAKVFFVVLSRTGRLVRIELACTALQVAASIAVAAAGLGPIAVCAAVSAGSILDNVLVAAAAERMLPAGAGHFSRRALVARSLPLGALSVMTRVYLTIDLVLLGAYISGPRLGDYAAASKLLTVLAGLAGAVMTAALPTLSSRAAAGEQLQALVGRVWHWLVVGALPVFAALGLFAPLLVRLSIGPDYAHAVPLVRILSIAGAITVLSNLVGNLQVALHRMRALFIQNAAAIVLNVSANLVLIPRDGVYAAAWITVATEALVCSAALLSLRRDISYARLLALSLRPLAAVAAGATVGLLLIGSQALGLLAASGVFLLALCVLRAWPIELPLPGWLVLRAGSR
jgi:O-antigen/teichoic acid export membrane protein